MNNYLKIKCRNGVPTKATINAIVDQFNRTGKQIILNFNHSYGKKNNRSSLLWSGIYQNKTAVSFVDFASEYGVRFGSFDEAEVLKRGSVEVVPIQESKEKEEEAVDVITRVGESAKDIEKLEQRIREQA